MPIEFRCPQCMKLLRVGDDAMGKQAKCPACGATAQVPNSLVEPALPSPPSFSPPPPPASGNPFGPSGENPFSGGYTPPLAPASDNPYAAPLSGGESTAGVARPTKITINGVIEDGWSVFQKNMGMMLLTFFVEFVILQAVNIGTAIPMVLVQQAAQDELVMVAVALGRALLMVLVAVWLGGGRDLYFLQTAKGLSPSFSVMFTGHLVLLRRFLLVVIMLLANVVFFLPAVFAGVLTAAMAQDEDAGFIVGLGVAALCVVPWAWFALTYFQAWYVCLDQPVGVFEGMRVSGEITRGNRLSLFALGVIIGLLFFAGACACYIGLFFTAPLAYMMSIVAYMHMSGQRVAGASYVIPPRERALPAQPNFLT